MHTAQREQPLCDTSDQLERIRAYGALKDFDLTEVVEDNGISAGKPSAARDGGKKLLSILKRARRRS